MSKLAVGNLACALIAISLVIYVFTHPRCFTAAGADYAPYRLFVLWCLAELLAIIAIVLGLAGLWRSRGRSLFTWLLLATSLLVVIGGIVYPVVHYAREVADEMSQPGFHGFGK